MTVLLESDEPHDGDKVADMEATSSGVEAVVAGDLLSCESVRCAGGGVEQRTSPLEVFSYVFKFCVGCHWIVLLEPVGRFEDLGAKLS